MLGVGVICVKEESGILACYQLRVRLELRVLKVAGSAAIHTYRRVRADIRDS